MQTATQAAPKDAATPAVSCDVLVIGGGPGGSTISAFLSKQGRKVILLEKAHHPRFHIGESLLPLNMPLLERLGVRDEIHKIGLVKNGAEFNSPGYKPAVYYFSRAMDKTYPSAYEVRRADFDNALLRNSARLGTDVREGMRVTDVEFRAGRSALVHAIDEAGSEHIYDAKFVVDASGRDTFLANRFKIKNRNAKHNSAAVFGHFKNAVRRSGQDEGNISVYWFDHGWFWMIPLRDGSMSVGAVCWPYYLASRKTSVDQFLLDTIAMCPEMAARLKDATLMAPATATGNFSYQAERLAGENYLMVGDAFAFVDPVFSSGVFLAMNSGEMGSKVVEEFLQTGKLSAKTVRNYEKTIRGGIKTFSWFIYRITTPALRKMFMSPRNTFRMEEAILSLLAADIFRGTPIRKPLLAFKTIYYIASIINFRESFVAWRKRRRAWHTRLAM